MRALFIRVYSNNLKPLYSRIPIPGATPCRIDTTANLFPAKLRIERRHPGDVPSWPSEAGHDAIRHRIATVVFHDDRDRRRGPPESPQGGSIGRNKHVKFEAYQLRGKVRKSVGFVLGKSPLYENGLALVIYWFESYRIRRLQPNSNSRA